jgi:hypothetical protein
MKRKIFQKFSLEDDETKSGIVVLGGIAETKAVGPGMNLIGTRRTPFLGKVLDTSAFINFKVKIKA